MRSFENQVTVFKTSLPRSEAYWGITKKIGHYGQTLIKLLNGYILYLKNAKNKITSKNDNYETTNN